MPYPVRKFRVGSISVAIWQNDSKDGNKFYSVTLDRRYKDKDGSWKSSNNLGINDLPKAILALQKAYEFVLFKEPELQEDINEDIKENDENNEEINGDVVSRGPKEDFNKDLFDF
ncbi:MAG: hypothetical protein N3D73_02415 [Candidatus Diapherotrites archaeon]|nr:hypothetical protein [Candidatus Diapherotrites archaeon]